jgi:predicted AAA+ superfamily ATPase
MAHLRDRGLVGPLTKQLKFWPIVTILGPRQSGKSTFLRELAFGAKKSSYVSLDKLAFRRSASQNPEGFLTQFEVEPLIVDEAHKSPELFDEIKALVDEDRRPGRFILTGSVRFSSKVGIRESFTGRSANLRFDSMTLGETTNETPSLRVLRRYFQMGGMPAVCFLRDADQIERYWTEWLDSTCRRDLHELSLGRLSSDLALQILELACQLEFPDSAAIAAKLRVDARRIRTHLEALEDLFLLRRWEPDEGSVGKTMMLPFDCGLASHFKATPQRLWQIGVAHELLNQARFSGKKEPLLRYNKTSRGSFCDFVLDDRAIRFNDEPFPSSRMMLTVAALEKRLPRKKIIVASQTDQPSQKIGTRSVSVPWASLFGSKS